jgi:NADH-quinone oxidoreductase subunit L
MALVGLVQTDIKRVVAYSTLSQLGYMTVALGASAYSIAIFHLTTHAFFKALLFLGAGAVIIALHHEQDMRKMGGLRRALPITYGTCIVGSLALAGIPPFAGFFSKDAIIEAVAHATIPGAGLTYVAVLIGVFVTALYSFRLIFMVFHGERAENLNEAHDVNEPGWVVTFPLIALAIPSVVAGAILVEPVLSGRLFANAITEPAIATGSHTTAGTMLLHGVSGLPFWLAVAGVIAAWVLYCAKPRWPSEIASGFAPIYRVLQRKYGFDELYQCVFMRGSRYLGERLWQTGDVKLIDGMMVNGTANLVGRLAEIIRHLQSGYIYHYAFAMIIGLVAAMSWHLWV